MLFWTSAICLAPFGANVGPTSQLSSQPPVSGYERLADWLHSRGNLVRQADNEEIWLTSHSMPVAFHLVICLSAY